MKKYVVIILFYALNVFGVPYDTGYIVWTQPNGDTFIARHWGDEFIWWMEDEFGYRIIQDSDGYYYYVELDANGEYTPSDILVTENEDPLEDSYLLERTSSRLAVIESNRSDFQIEMEVKMEAIQSGTSSIQTTGDFELAVVLIDFADTLNKGYAKAKFDSLFFSTNYWQYRLGDLGNSPHPEGKEIFGSLRDYFADQSINQLNIKGINGSKSIVNPVDSNNEPIWVTMEQNRLYYATLRNSNNSDWDQGAARNLMKATAEAQLSTDLDQFDGIIFVYAGGLEGGALWPHNNGKEIVISERNEKNRPNDDTFLHIGTIVHEFGHLLGAGDEYNDYTSYTSLGVEEPKSWSIMSNGNNNGPEGSNHACPAPFCPAYRIMFGWVTPIIFSFPVEDMDIIYNATTPNYYKINAFNSDEYFIVERRKKTGYDEFTPSSDVEGTPNGILIWHFAQEGKSNNNFVGLKNAHGGNTFPINYRFPLAPGTTQNINDITFPSLNLRNGNNSFLDITVDWVGISQSAHAEIDVSSNVSKITSNTSWTKTNIVINEPVIINSGITLTIEEGANISTSSQSPEQIKIYVSNGAHLIINGNKTEPVLFNSIGGIEVIESGTIEMNYAELLNCKKAVLLNSNSSTCEINNSLIANSDEVIQIQGNITITNSKFINSGIRILESQAGSVIKNSIFSNDDNTSCAIQFDNPTSTYVEVVNCTINNFSTGLDIGSIEGMAYSVNGTNPITNILIENCIISNCSNSIDVDDGNIIIKYNNFFNNTYNTLGIYSSTYNPNYVDASNGDFHLLHNSYCIDAGNPTSTYNNETFPNGSRINLGAYGNTSEAALSSNVISQATNWSSDIYVTENISVNSNVTLTIAAGTNITFQNGSALIVNGTLNVNGISTNKVTFDFIAQNSTTQNGVRINNGASATIDNAIIKNAYRGIYVNEDLILTNSEIKDCQTGLYQYYSDVVRVTNSNIHNNRYGAYLYASNGEFSESQFEYNAIAGVECWNNSSPKFAPGDYPIQATGNNEFNYNDVGLISNHSYPELGRISCTNFGGNNIFANSDIVEMEVMNYSTIYAENNYWGTNAPSSSLFLKSQNSTLDYQPYLTSAPTSAIALSPEEEEFDKKFTPQLGSANISTKSFVFTAIDKSSYNEKWPLEWKLLYARNLIRVHKYNSASDICESVIAENPDSSLSHFALHLLHQARVKSNNKSKFNEYIQSQLKPKAKKGIFGYAELLAIIDEKEDRVSMLDKLKEKYSNYELVESILYDKFLYYFNEKRDIENAKLVSDELGKLYPESESYYASQRHLGNDVVKPTEQLLAKEAVNEATTEIPQTYELLGNYPNPFNPSTTIKYALPYSSDVELTIYDITGKVITTLNRNGQSAGYQNIVWNGNSQQGSRVSSGVYFYRFKATSIDGSNKVFEKTAKMLMLK